MQAPVCQALILRSLPCNLNSWTKSQKKGFSRGCEAFAPFLHAALEAGDQTSVRASWLHSSRAFLSGGRSSNLQGRDAYLNGRTGEAFKRINSHGVAEHSVEGLERLQKLLPSLKEMVPPLPAELGQFKTSEPEVRKFLFNSCTGS